MTSPSLSPVLVTGGCGFVAFHIITHILSADPSCEIHVIDIDTTHNRVHGVTYHTIDLSSASDVSTIIHTVRPLTIFHTASPDSMIVVPSRFETVIVSGTRNLLAAAAQVGSVKALIYTSTSSVVHDNLTDLVDADETLPVLRPPVQQRVYTLAKATAEEEILAANRATGDASMLTVSLRPALCFGERDRHFFAKVLAVARAGRTRFQMGPGTNEYDYVYIGNLADAQVRTAQLLLTAWGKPPPPAPERRIDGENFNVTNNERMRFWDFNRASAAAAGHPVAAQDVVVIPVALGLLIGWLSEWIVWLVSRGRRQPNMTREGIRFSTMTRTLNGEKAVRMLGYRPRVSLGDGIERSARWFVENPDWPAREQTTEVKTETKKAQ